MLDLRRELLAEEDPKTVNRIVEEDWQQMPYKQLFEVSICSDIHLLLEHCVCELVIYFVCTSRSHLSDVSFAAVKTHHRYVKYTCRTFPCREGTAFVVGSRIQLFVKRRVDNF